MNYEPLLIQVGGPTSHGRDVLKGSDKMIVDGWSVAGLGDKAIAKFD